MKYTVVTPYEILDEVLRVNLTWAFLSEESHTENRIENTRRVTWIRIRWNIVFKILSQIVILFCSEIS